MPRTNEGSFYLKPTEHMLLDYIGLIDDQNHSCASLSRDLQTRQSLTNQTLHSLKDKKLLKCYRIKGFAKHRKFWKIAAKGRQVLDLIEEYISVEQELKVLKMAIMKKVGVKCAKVNC